MQALDNEQKAERLAFTVKKSELDFRLICITKEMAKITTELWSLRFNDTISAEPASLQNLVNSY